MMCARNTAGGTRHASRRSSPRLRVTGRTSRSKSFASGMLRSPLASKQSGPSARAKASRSRDSGREPWLASGITGLPQDTPTTDLEQWDGVREQVHEALREAVGDAEWEQSDPDELWRENSKLRSE